ncbi:hypothetical protein PENSPDRAFT_671766 [Peniophora sp. CONT]|nr:hypothetical protein PENSPDRAFT_671766 [Peniophora sp. CONT]
MWIIEQAGSAVKAELLYQSTDAQSSSLARWVYGPGWVVEPSTGVSSPAYLRGQSEYGHTRFSDDLKGSNMTSDSGLPFDFSFCDPYDTVPEYVVLQGYNPGCTNKWGAILATHGLEGSLVIRTGSEGAALELWRKELVTGNSIGCLGTASAAERLVYGETLRKRMFPHTHSEKGTSGRSQGNLKPPVKRTGDSIQVPSSLRSQSSTQDATEGPAKATKEVTFR